jgi:hypothetical protein
MRVIIGGVKQGVNHVGGNFDGITEGRDGSIYGMNGIYQIDGIFLGKRQGGSFARRAEEV